MLVLQLPRQLLGFDSGVGGRSKMSPMLDVVLRTTGATGAWVGMSSYRSKEEVERQGLVVDFIHWSPLKLLQNRGFRRCG